jgi:uncharacterized repeat protein (TIGR02543 family)
VREGYTFAGWVTESGERISPEMTADKNLKVSASWIEGTVPVSGDTGQGNIEKPGVSFRDVNENDWYYEYVIDLCRDKIISGYPDGSFRPGDPVKYGEALKLIMLAAGYEPQAATGSHWASGYLDTAISEGILGQNAVPDLDLPISRIAVAHIAAKAMGLDESDIESPFTDTSDGYVLSLYEKGILRGSSENGVILYLPDKCISRAEISAVVWRIYSLVLAS